MCEVVSLQAGFVLVATCLNPAEYNWPGCTDFQFFQAWDPDFVNIINNEFPTVSALPWFAMKALIQDEL